MKVTVRWLTLVTLTIFQYILFLFFAKGFFPQKVLLSGINTFESIQEAAQSSLLSSLFSQSHDISNFSSSNNNTNSNSESQNNIKKTINGKVSNNIKNPHDTFDKLIFIVIDALRSDFVFSSNSSMTNLHQLLNRNAAIGFTGFSNPPTVTLPRLKSLTTGSISNFLDAILNINDNDSSSSSNLVNQDSWLKQFKLRKRGFSNGANTKNDEEEIDSESRINFFGDDTWLKIFPDFFDEYEGTSSFFVSDFTEVDNNVTRHIDTQLVNDDKWDGLILHYLGLDHIGHKNGPNSIFMPGKQRELDGIIAKIYQDYVVPKYENENQNTLMVVLGDHGMNEIGNHGGSSISETSAGLVFMSPVFEQENYKFQSLQNEDIVPVVETEQNKADFQYLQSINQIDLIPTLCHFFNMPIPKNNLGVVIKKFLLTSAGSDNEDEKKNNYGKIFYKLLENAYQFKTLVEGKFGKSLSFEYVPNRHFNDDSEYQKLDSLWHDSVLKLEYSYNDKNYKNGDFFISTNDQDLHAYIDSIYAFLQETQEFLQNSSTNYDLTTLLYSIAGLVAVSVVLSIIFFQTFWQQGLKTASVSFFGFLLIMGFSTFGSSLVEEEHQLWWFFVLVYVIYLSFGLLLAYRGEPPKSSSTNTTAKTKIKIIIPLIVAQLVGLRAIRFWNSSGQKYNFLDEFTQLKLSYHLSPSQHQNVALFVLVIVVFLHCLLVVSGGLNILHKAIAFVMPFTLSLIILSFKINFEHANTGGENFVDFFLKVVEKVDELFKNNEGESDVKNLLIMHAQLVFKFFAVILAIRVVILKVKWIWFSPVIESTETEFVKQDQSEIDPALGIKQQLKRGSNGAAKKKKSQFKKVFKTKRKYIDGKFQFLNDISNLVTLILIMQSKLENVGLYFVFFIIRETGTRLINYVIHLELQKLKQTEAEAEAEAETNDINVTDEEKKINFEFREKALKVKLIVNQNMHTKIAFYTTIQMLFLQNLTFFQFGFTNSLSTVDLANAYNGTTSYNLLIVGILTFVSNFASPIYWLINSLLWQFNNDLVNNETQAYIFNKVKFEVLYIRYLVLFVFYTVFGLFLAVACYNLRYHLFIWTVFSPKLLFFGAWNFLVNGVIELVVVLLLCIYR